MKTIGIYHLIDREILDLVAELHSQGVSREQIRARGPSLAYQDGDWGQNFGETEQASLQGLALKPHRGI